MEYARSVMWIDNSVFPSASCITVTYIVTFCLNPSKGAFLSLADPTSPRFIQIIPIPLFRSGVLEPGLTPELSSFWLSWLSYSYMLARMLSVCVSG